MDSSAIKPPQIKVARASSSKDKADFSLIAHAIKEAKTMHIFGSDILLPLATFSDGGLM